MAKGGAYVVRGACMAKGGMHGRGARVVGGHVCQGVCAGGGCVPKRWPLKRVVYILLECILVDYFS